jgi:hypothetical protein
MPNKQHILGLLDDMVSDLLYYNRKGDDDCPEGAIEQAIKDGVVTIDDMVDKFRELIIKNTLE